jgi:hypothetical protein
MCFVSDIDLGPVWQIYAFEIYVFDLYLFNKFEPSRIA